MFELGCFVAGLVTFSGFMSLFEISVLSCNPLKLKILAEKYKHLRLFNTRAKEIASSVMVTNIVVDVAGASYGGTMAYKLFGNNIEYTAYTVAVTVLLLLFSTLIPKLYASSNAPKVLRIFGIAIISIYYITRPAVALLYLFVSPFVKGEVKEVLTQSEINSVINLAESNNIISDRQSSLISNILSLTDKTVADILPHGTPVETVSVKDFVSDYQGIIENGRHKRYVVTLEENDSHSPVGIVLYRDMIKAHMAGLSGETRIVDIMHSALITNKNELAIALVDKLDKNADHITVVVDDQNKMLGVLQADDIIGHLIR